MITSSLLKEGDEEEEEEDVDEDEDERNSHDAESFQRGQKSGPGDKEMSFVACRKILE